MAHVLIVDDDRAIREMLICALQCEGYETQTLADGSQVLDTLAAMPDHSVALVDLMMPQVDGWAVFHALEARPDLLTRHAVVAMSAALMDRDECPAGARAVLRKPFDLERLYRLVAELSTPLPATAAKADIAVAAQ